MNATTPRPIGSMYARHAQLMAERSEPEVQRAIAHIHANRDELSAQIQNELHSGISATFGILCLSESLDEELMWSHYTDKHTGFAIEFDTAHSAFSALGNWGKVEYVPEVPNFTLGKPPEAFWKRKASSWSYEKEWRNAAFLKDWQ